MNNRNNLRVYLLKSDHKLDITIWIIPVDPAGEDKLRTESWLFAIGGKKKGRIYGVRELARKFKSGNTLTYREPSTFSHDSKQTREIKQLREDNDKLSQQMKALLNHVLLILPPQSRSAFEQEVQQQQPQQQSSSQQKNEHEEPPNKQHNEHG